MYQFSKVYSGDKFVNGNPVELFKHRGKYDASSFNMLMSFYEKKIDKFISNCRKLYKDITNNTLPLDNLHKYSNGKRNIQIQN